MDDLSKLERLHAEHAGAVRAYVRRRIDAEEADEVVADVFVVAWRRGKQMPAEPRTWLLGIARRVLANKRRAAKRQRALYERLAHEAGAAPPHSAAPEVDAPVLRALAALPAADREVVLLVTWDGLSHTEAAEVLGTRASAVTMRVSRARRRLEQLLEREERPTAVPRPLHLNPDSPTPGGH